MGDDHCTRITARCRRGSSPTVMPTAYSEGGHMIRQNPMRVALTVLLLGLPATRADAQNGAQPAPSDQPPVIDPEAMTALKKMGDYLRTLDVFQIKVNITKD